MRAWVCFLALCLAQGAAFADKAEDERKEIQKIEQDTLAKLYSVQPSAKSTIEGAAGYAVFSNFGMKILVAGTGSGKGVAVNRKTGQRTYMRMGELQAGIGIGVKKFQVVFVFETPDKLDRSSPRAGSSEARPPRRPRPVRRVRPCRGRWRWLPEYGCTSSPTRGWRWKRP